MFHVALWEPEIPPNTGNIGRLCAATGATLHLIGRLGFRIDSPSLRRAGLDYWPALELQRHATFEDFKKTMIEPMSLRVLCFSARAQRPYNMVRFRSDDVLLFGGESQGLPSSILESYPASTFVIPMPSGKVRSLNLATAVGIVLYEGLRQLNVWHE